MDNQEKKKIDKPSKDKKTDGKAPVKRRPKPPVPEKKNTEEKPVEKVEKTEKKAASEKKKPEKKAAGKEGQHEKAAEQKPEKAKKQDGEKLEKEIPAHSEKIKKRKKKSKTSDQNLDDDLILVSDDTEEVTEAGETAETREASEKKKTGRGKKAAIIIGSVFGALALLYLGAAVFFMSHFYYGTMINGVRFSMKTAAGVEAYFEQQVKGYKLTIEEKDDVEESITGQEISLEYHKGEEVEKALKAQNPFLWPKVFFQPSAAEVKIEVSYDRTALEEKVKNLKCITEVEQTESVSAQPKFDGEKFVVEPEQIGKKVNQDVLIEKVKEYVSGFQNKLNMEEEACYTFPKYTSDSPEVQAACDKMNEYCQASITYSMGSNTEVVDKALISTWLTCDADLNVTFHTDAVNQYMAEFVQKYNTVGTTRQLTTPTGKTTQVSGGTYGWKIDEAAEAQALIASIQNKEVTTKEPAYTQTAASHDGADWGNTYLEVDLTEQHVWFISEGNVAFEANVVTGLPTPARQTPEGVYDILEKLRNKTLRGEKRPDGTYEYETPVSYWMRVTYQGVGFHDATWQPYFGGDRYKTNGSHGCINMAYNDIATMYEMVPVRCPVVMHY